MTTKQRNKVAPELLPPVSSSETVELLRGGAALTKAENDTLAQVAVTRPRDPLRCLEKAIAELDMDPEFAEKQYYVIPYQGATGKQNVEGLSIKAAMALARNWGNCTVSSRVMEDREDAVMLEGVAIDFETNFRVCKPVTVSKYYRDRKTRRMVKWRDDRLPHLVGSGASKAVRNAILNMIPEPMQKRYWNHAKSLAAQLITGQSAGEVTTGGGKSKSEFKDPANVIRRILEGFEPFHVSREHIEAKLGHSMDQLTMDEVGTLAGIRNALQAGSTDAYQAFGVGGPQGEPGNSDGPPVAERSADEEVGELFGGKAE